MSVNFRVFARSPELRPKRAHPDDSGLDLCFDYYGTSIDPTNDLRFRDNHIILLEQAKIRLPTGVYAAVNSGYELQIRPRSGLAGRGLILMNSPGTVDASYRGEIMLSFWWTGDLPLMIHHGDRIAQMVIAKVELDVPEFMDSIEALGSTVRGANGFGSSGNA